MVLILFYRNRFVKESSFGFIPNEDQGVFYAIIRHLPGSTLRWSPTQEIASWIPEIKSVSLDVRLWNAFLKELAPIQVAVLSI